MSLKEYDHVRIKDKDVTGIIVESFAAEDGKTAYIVEDDERNGEGDPLKLDFPLYDCLANELEKIE